MSSALNEFGKMFAVLDGTRQRRIQYSICMNAIEYDLIINILYVIIRFKKELSIRDVMTEFILVYSNSYHSYIWYKSNII